MTALNIKTAEIYVNVLKQKGEVGLYRYIVAAGVKRLIIIENPEIEILDISEGFFALYRRTGEDTYFIIGKIIRKAAHTLYRQFLRMNTSKIPNRRFLQAIK
jgi:hypothetical protein